MGVPATQPGDPEAIPVFWLQPSPITLQVSGEWTSRGGLSCCLFFLSHVGSHRFRTCLSIPTPGPSLTHRFESCWPALMKDAQGVVIVFNADVPSHLKELEMWHSCFVQPLLLQDAQCLLIAHHKPGSAAGRGSLSLGERLV